MNNCSGSGPQILLKESQRGLALNTKVSSSLRLFALASMVLLNASCKTPGELVLPDRPGEAVQLREEQMSYIQVVQAEKDALGASLHTTGRVSHDEDRVARIVGTVTERKVEQL